MKATAILATTLSMLVPLTSGLASTDTITWGGDNSRTGYQTNHNMDPAIVGSADFAQIFKTALPGNYNGAAEQIFSQPLVYTPSDDTNQYVYFATTQNNVYKLDAKTGQILLSRNLAIPFLTADLDGCVDINPLIGVTSTGVIDSATDTLYLMSKTYANQAGGNGAQGKPNGRYYLHALNVNDLTERANFPVNLEGIVARNNPVRSFNGGIQHQRPALLHSGEYIYAGFASHCVQYNFTGWLMGFDKTTGAVVERYATEGDGVPNTTPGGGIWMSGGGLASDDQGSLFFGTGNGFASQLSTIPVEGHSPPTSLEEAAVHMTLNDDGSVTVVDFFMPQEKQALDGADKDLGTSPLELLPSEFSCGSITHMGVITGKSGKTYFLNLDDLGGYRTGPNSGDRVIQVYQNENSVYAGAGVYPLEGGYIYINVIRYPTHVFKFSCVNGVPSFIKVADSPESNAYILGVSHGTVTSLNGEEGTGLLWTTDVQGNNLRIYNAIPENGYLTEIRNFSVPGTTKFTRAVFGDGRVYMGTMQGYVYGFGAPTTPPLNCSTPVDFGSLDIVDTAVTAQVTCTAVIATTIKSLQLTDPDFDISSSTTFPATQAAGSKFTFSASFKPTTVGLLTGTVSIATTNGVTGYSSTTSVLLEGTSLSAGALFAVSPSVLTFTNVVIGATPGGVEEPVIFSNVGNSTLTISDILFSTTSATGPWVEGTSTSNGTEIGAFTLSGLPSTIAADGGQTIEVTFNPTVGGNFTLYVQVSTNGGNQTFEVDANAGPGPTCLLQFQTPDGLDWVTYDKNMNFTFGNVTENTSRSLLLRVTNNGTSDAVPLSLTVSKPPFGVAGIIGAANQIDLAEGTVLKPGESATASLYCAVPKEQWNTDTYYGAANWTMNTNDPNWDKQYIQFSCEAISEQAPPLQSDGQGVYRYAGCFKENNPGRQLSKQLYGSANNTAAMCIAACADGGYTYCGTQYNSECWAGNSIPVQQVAEGDCNYPCAGNLNQICGGNGVGADAGGAYISLYAVDGADTNSSTVAPGGPVVNPGDYGFVSLGCYHEPATSRALANQLSVSSQTVDTCLAAAALGGYTYAGLEYGGECWVGTSLDTGAAQVNLTTCAMTCNNNGSEYCGGSLLLNVYQFNATAAVSSAMSSTMSTSTISGASTVTTSKTTTTAAHTTKPTVGNWVYQGCYTEGSTGRALAGLSQTNNNMTYEECADYCASYAYFGVEYGDQCYCGNYLATGSNKTAETDCSTYCAGDASEFCGAGNRLNVYYQTGMQTGPPAPKARVSSYVYLGCYSEATTSRALASASFSVANMTEEACAAYCSTGTKTSYTMFGVEYSTECYCGNALGLGSVQQAEGSCNMACGGSAFELCGGPSLLNVYTYSPAPSSSSSSLADPPKTSSSSSVDPPSSSSSSSSSLSSSSSMDPSSSSSVDPLSSSSSVVTSASTNSGSLLGGGEPKPSSTPASASASPSSASVPSVSASSSSDPVASSSSSSSPVSSSSVSSDLVSPSSSSSGSTSSSSSVSAVSSLSASAVSSLSSSDPTSTSSFSSLSASLSASPVAVGSIDPASSSVAKSSSSAQSSSSSSASDPAGSSRGSSSSDPVDPSTTFSSSAVKSLSVSPSDPAPSSSSYAASSSQSPSSSSASPSSSSSSVKASSPSQASLTPASTRASSSPSPSSSSAASSSSSQSGAGLVDVASSSITGSSSSSSSSYVKSSATVPSSTTASTSSSHSTLGGTTSSSNVASVTNPVKQVSDPTVPSTPPPSPPSSSQSGAGLTDAGSSSVPHPVSLSSTLSSTSSPAAAPSSGGLPPGACYQPVVAQGNANFTILNCFQEPSSGHLLSDFIVQNRTSMTVQMCLSKCWAYTYAGLENGDQCWCGDGLNLSGSGIGTSGSVISETQCNVVCPGNTTEYCGAEDKLLVYNLTRID